MNNIYLFFKKYFKCWDDKPLKKYTNSLTGIELINKIENEYINIDELINNKVDNNGFIDIPLN